MSNVKKTKANATTNTLWDEVKDKTINVFGLEQKVSEVCEPLPTEDKCYLVLKATAVLPALEVCLGSAYKLSTSDKYVVLERA